MSNKLEQIEQTDLGGSNIRIPPQKVTVQITQSKYWCFTYNNYKSADIEKIESICSIRAKEYIFQEETGEQGTPHLQGYIEFIKKTRPMSEFKGLPGMIWKKRYKDSTRDACVIYCSKNETKTGNRYTNIEVLPRQPRPLKVISNLYPWQKKLESILLEEPDDRTIHWYWERKGNVGKSAFCKYLCVKHGAMMTGGKATDAKYGIVKYNEKRGHYPDIVIMDIPRQVLDYVSYTSIEEIKNGCFFSTKYECDQVLMNSPHIICFANEPPEVDMMSKDRWNIVCLDEE